MKKLLYLLIPLIIIACNGGDKKPGTVSVPSSDTTKVIDTTIIEPGIAPVADLPTTRSSKADKQKKEKISCGFGYKKFNNRKRPIEEAPGGVKGKPPKKPPVVQPPTDPPTPPPPDEPPTTNVGGTIYLDFFGGNVTGMWGNFTVSDAGFGQPEIDYVLNEVKLHFTQFSVNVTTDEAVFNAAPIGKRIRIVITESYQWYGQAGGVAYLNSFFWTDNTPAFVFSLLLNYSIKNVAEACAHEAAHTLGGRHQAVCENGVITSQYNWGYETASGWYAPTLGASYSAVPRGSWFPDGPTPLGCTNRQNDVAIITAAVGLKQ